VAAAAARRSLRGDQDLRPIALTTGEPAGIGPDLCLALVDARPLTTPLVLVGDRRALTARANELGLAFSIPDYDPETDHPVSLAQVPLPAPATAGELDPVNSTGVIAMLEHAVQGCLEGRYAAMVTAPVHKGVINDAGIGFSGHTEFIAARTGGDPVMMLVAEGLRVALATVHLPLAAVPAAISVAHLSRVLRVLDQDLTRRFGLPHPRILVLGLNPHAGEGGYLGGEERAVIEPCLAALRDEGLTLTGPVSADTAFTPALLEGQDAVLAMYHDQGLPVLKHASFGHAVNVTLGLPIVRTSVDHGTALSLAGTGRADSGSLLAALELAVELAARRDGAG
jgi:4-hydroxythreonine-4-phosphate dehydrogenase